MFIYILAAVFNFVDLKKVSAARAYSILSLIGSVLNLAALVAMIIVNRRLPLATGYEFLLSFALVMVVIYRFMVIKDDIRSAGGFVMLIAALLLFAAAIQIPGNYNGSGPLMPALKSPWLGVHVLTAVIAYGGFALAASLAIMNLAGEMEPKTSSSIYNLVAGSFAMLSLSIVLGAVWAEQAWGTYWSWDPKETWAMITWIIYAIYLHLHRRQGWKGKKADILVIVGFIIVLFTFFGVNYLMSGLHSYS
ncbi:MAG: cytochrome c biogenesis protein CcsA [Syntrophomonadaceae bacterium]|nr:cytochrome c biogenesis protein CcsA [Syntrophomonadaceae bacterium]